MAMKLSSHSLLLLIDIERAFCAGAWLSAIVLSQASIEATIRQVVKEDYESGAARLFGNDPELRWLRELRNEVLHSGEPGTPSKIWMRSSDNIPECHAALEPEARRAVVVAYRAMYVDTEAYSHYSKGA
jgi:hypothetical protein